MQTKMCVRPDCRHKGKLQSAKKFSGNNAICNSCILEFYVKPRNRKLKSDRDYLSQFSPI